MPKAAPSRCSARRWPRALRAALTREELFVVSKVYPHNASAKGVVAACERSLQRLQLEHIDLYLLHWRGAEPLRDTVQGFERLQQRGLIRHWGVSNFDVDDLQELFAVPGGTACAANQVWYSLSKRGIEFDLLPWQQQRRMPLMAYSPIDQGALSRHAGLAALAAQRGVTPAQLALAWVLRQPGVMAMPKSSDPHRLRANWQAAALVADRRRTRGAGPHVPAAAAQAGVGHRLNTAQARTEEHENDPASQLLPLGRVALAVLGPARAGAERAIDKQVVVNATLDQAWDAWTTREGIVAFLAPDAKIEPRVGGAFEIYFDPYAPAGSKGADGMRFMALQPKKMLSFDWNAPPSLPEARQQRSFVVVRFEPLDDRQTRVTLHHTGWGDGGEWDKAYAYFDRAWGNVLANLGKRFDKGPQDWGEWLAQLKAMHAAASRAASAPK